MKARLFKVLLAMTLAAWASVASAEIVIGGKNFTEQQLLASMTNQYLKANDFETDIRVGMGSTVLRKALVSYAATPVVRKETLEQNPKLEELLDQLSAKLDDQTMATLNARVDVDKETIEDVAEDFLKQNDLI